MWFHGYDNDNASQDALYFEDSLSGLADFSLNSLRDDESLGSYNYAALEPNPRNQLYELPNTSFSFLDSIPPSQTFDFIYEEPQVESSSSEIIPSGLSDDTNVESEDESARESESESESESDEEEGETGGAFPSQPKQRKKYGPKRRVFTEKESHVDISMTQDVVMSQWVSGNPFYGNQHVITRESSSFSEIIEYLTSEPSNEFPLFHGFDDMSAMFGDAGVSLNNKNGLVEQVIQFPEFEDRTFGLLGNNDTMKMQNFIPSPRRGVRITPQLLIDVLSSDPKSCVLIDARFGYEYEGSTIGRSQSSSSSLGEESNISINIDRYWDPLLVFNTLWESSNTRMKPRYPGKKLIIFCEFSSLRGPGLYRNITLLDHAVKLSQLRASSEVQISYPEIYLLQGGYRAFFDYTISNMERLENEESVFVVTSSSQVSTESAFISEFSSHTSESLWEEKKSFISNKRHEYFLLTLGFKSLVDIWNPFDASYDSFSAFKREIESTKHNVSRSYRERRSLPQSEYLPPSQRQRVGEELN
jgi:hypothetical protein